MRPLAAALGLAVLLMAAPAARAQSRSLVHLVAGDDQVTLALLDDEVVDTESLDPAVPVTRGRIRAFLDDPARVVWIVSSGRKTRITYEDGAEAARETWDRLTDVPLDPDLHLVIPRAVREVDVPDWALAPTDGNPLGPEPASQEAFVGAAMPAADLFGETLGGLVPAPQDLPSPLAFSGYVETLWMFGEDGPSAHVLDTGLAGNRALEAKEVVFNLDASLGDATRFFGQMRVVRFNRFDMRIAMLQVGDPGEGHWRLGRQVNPFGTFPLRNLSDRNPLYGYPLPYFYRSSLRTDRVPAGTAALLAGRGQGAGGAGMAMAGPGQYQTYLLRVQPIGRKAQATFGLSNGALSVTENVTRNDAFGVIGNLAFNPDPAWKFGVSASVAPYLAGNATGLAAGESAEDFDQTLVGFDMRYSGQRLTLDFEALWNTWETPSGAGLNELESFGWYVEGRYTLRPKLYFAWRYSEIEFDEVPNGAGGTTTWDADADRLEVGFGYRPSRALLVKMSAQDNQTEVTPEPEDNVFVMQLIGSF